MVRFSASVVTTSKPIARYHEAVDGLQLHAFGDAWTYGIGAAVYSAVRHDRRGGITQNLVIGEERFDNTHTRAC